MRPRKLNGKQTLNLYKRVGIKTTGMTKFTELMWTSASTLEDIKYWSKQAHLEMKCTIETWELF